MNRIFIPRVAWEQFHKTLFFMQKKMCEVNRNFFCGEQFGRVPQQRALWENVGEISLLQSANKNNPKV